MDLSLPNRSYSALENSRVNKSEPQIEIQTRFQANTYDLQNHVPLIQHTIIDKLDREYKACVRIDAGHGKNLFLIGFLLVKDVLCNNLLIDFNEQTLLQAFMISSPSNPFNQNSQDLLKKYQIRLSEFFTTVSKLRREHHLQLNSQVAVAEYLSNQCNRDSGLSYAVMCLGRCILIKCLIQGKMEKTPIYESLINTGWKVDEKYAFELFVICSQSLGYRFTCFVISDFGADVKIIGNGKNQAYIFDHSKQSEPFKAILLKSEDHVWQSDILVERQSNLLNKPSSKECIECALCKLELLKDNVYTNPTCGHNYCLYCLQDLENAHPGLKLCYLQKCDGSLDQTATREFIRKCTQSEPARPEQA